VLPDDKDMISSTIKDFVNSDIEVIITTAGMSVDPDDVTKFGIIDSGANVIKYGMPVLPGSMLLLADLNEAKIIGFPACGIYNKVSSFDLILPRILADIDITNDDIAKLGRNGIVE
jgi:formylmethanofuran dehydrogenase subunit E